VGPDRLALADALTITPSAMSFGGVGGGGNKIAIFTLTNPGTTTASLSAATITGTDAANSSSSYQPPPAARRPHSPRGGKSP